MANAAVSLKSIVEYFESLPDPRHTRNRRHLLGDVLVISVCGVIVGCSGPTSIEHWAKARIDWLRQVLALPGGIPSRDCIRRILSALRPEAFQACFQSWIAACITKADPDGAPEDPDARPTIAIDGKTLRRSHDRGGGLGPLHLVSAWASEHGLSLGQVAAAAKSNEITAIPELIDRIDVKGAVVTIDAIGCQKKIVERIVAQKGDYVLAVKANQPKLHQAVQEIFSDERVDELLRRPHRQHHTRDKGHGRDDERYYVLAKIRKDAPLKKEWPSVEAVGMAVRTTVNKDGDMSGDARCFITSRFLSGERFAQAVRGHWGIENSLHWVLDVTFDEDQSRTRQRRMADNLAWLRRFAISLLKRHPSKHSIKGKSQIAGWNNDFLLEVLAIQGV